MAGFTAKQVVALTGVPYKRLDSWANSGFLIPSIAEADGTGSRRLYSFQDLIDPPLRTNTIRDASCRPVVQNTLDFAMRSRWLYTAAYAMKGMHCMTWCLGHTA